MGHPVPGSNALPFDGCVYCLYNLPLDGYDATQYLRDGFVQQDGSDAGDDEKDERDDA